MQDFFVDFQEIIRFSSASGRGAPESYENWDRIGQSGKVLSVTHETSQRQMH
jgi:hypothetical protein